MHFSAFFLGICCLGSTLGTPLSAEETPLPSGDKPLPLSPLAEVVRILDQAEKDTAELGSTLDGLNGATKLEITEPPIPNEIYDSAEDSDSEPDEESTTVQPEGDEENTNKRSKKSYGESGTKICVEVRPNDPYSKPYTICRPKTDGYGPGAGAPLDVYSSQPGSYGQASQSSASYGQSGGAYGGGPAQQYGAIGHPSRPYAQPASGYGGGPSGGQLYGAPVHPSASYGQSSGGYGGLPAVGHNQLSGSYGQPVGAYGQPAGAYGRRPSGGHPSGVYGQSASGYAGPAGGPGYGHPAAVHSGGYAAPSYVAPSAEGYGKPSYGSSQGSSGGLSQGYGGAGYGGPGSAGYGSSSIDGASSHGGAQGGYGAASAGGYQASKGGYGGAVGSGNSGSHGSAYGSASSVSNGHVSGYGHPALKGYGGGSIPAYAMSSGSSYGGASSAYGGASSAGYGSPPSHASAASSHGASYGLPSKGGHASLSGHSSGQHYRLNENAVSMDGDDSNMSDPMNEGEQQDTMGRSANHPASVYAAHNLAGYQPPVHYASVPIASGPPCGIPLLVGSQPVVYIGHSQSNGYAQRPSYNLPSNGYSAPVGAYSEPAPVYSPPAPAYGSAASHVSSVLHAYGAPSSAGYGAPAQYVAGAHQHPAPIYSSASAYGVQSPASSYPPASAPLYHKQYSAVPNPVQGSSNQYGNSSPSYPNGPPKGPQVGYRSAESAENMKAAENEKKGADQHAKHEHATETHKPEGLQTTTPLKEGKSNDNTPTGRSVANENASASMNQNTWKQQ